MNRYFSALVWAFVILSVALAGRFGWAESDAVETLIIVLPALAFITLVRGCSCRCWGRPA